MRILWVKVGGLWPPDTGGRLRSLGILSELSRNHHITLLTTHLPGEDVSLLRRHLPDCERIVSVPYQPVKWNDWRFPFVLLRSWFSGLPVDLWKCRVPALRQAVQRLVCNDEVDLCVADFLAAMPNVLPTSPLPLMHFSHNVEHMIWKRLHDTEPRIWRRIPLAIEWHKMRRYERHACEVADMTITVSPVDRQLLATEAPGSLIRDIPTGVDVNYFTSRALETGGSGINDAQLVFTGSMDWQPNEDAMLYFIDEILPLIRRDVPGTGLTIVGRNPGKRLRSAAGDAGVTVTGRVDDVRPHVGKAAVFVVPLRIGGGTRLKIFEAMAMGKAVVSTGVGAEGLPILDGKHYMRADDPIGFASTVVGLLQDAARRRELGDAGRRLVTERFGWEAVAKEFDAFCREVVG